LSFLKDETSGDPRVRYVAGGAGFGLSFTDEGAELEFRQNRPGAEIGKSLRTATFRMGLMGQDESKVSDGGRVRVIGEEELEGKVNYLRGSDPAQWRTNLSTYARVRYRQVYPGVDLVFYGREGQLEYDFCVSPAGDAGRIRMQFPGAKEVRLETNGSLTVTGERNTVAFHKPTIYQERDGRREQVQGEFALAQDATGHATVGFRLGEYDHRLPLVIDPVLEYATYVEGSGTLIAPGPGYGEGIGDAALAIAVDKTGAAYVGGVTGSADFNGLSESSPTGQFPFESSQQSGFVSKYNSDGSLAYAAYIGYPGTRVTSIAVNAAGEAIVGGTVAYADFPLIHPFQSTPATGFVAKLNANGTGYVWSSYLGGTTVPNPYVGAGAVTGVAVDSRGFVYAAGYAGATDFPTLHAIQGALKGRQNGFVTKIKGDGSGLVWSTYLGGTDQTNGDYVSRIALDGSGNVYVTGTTFSTDFPTLNAVQQTNPSTAGSAFVSEIKTDGSDLVFSTYLGGVAGSGGNGISVYTGGSIGVTGFSRGDFPRVRQKFAVPPGYGMFIVKMAPSGLGLMFSDLVGGGSGSGISADAHGNLWVAGCVYDGTFPTMNPLVSAIPMYGGDIILTGVKADNSGLIFSTFFGAGSDCANGVAVDPAGSVYIVGSGRSSYFRTFNAYQPVIENGWSAGVLAKINPAPTGVETTTSMALNGTTQVVGQPVTMRVTAATSGLSGVNPVTTGYGSFVIDSNIVSALPFSANGSAFYKTTSLPVGTHKLQVLYNGTPAYNASASPTVNVWVVASIPVPVFSLPKGTYHVAQSVVISDAVTAATIYYTTDGTTPTAASRKYGGPLPVRISETIKAIAIEGTATSPVATTSYAIVP